MQAVYANESRVEEHPWDCHWELVQFDTLVCAGVQDGVRTRQKDNRSDDLRQKEIAVVEV